MRVYVGVAVIDTIQEMMIYSSEQFYKKSNISTH
jgi:hypothetical protein